MKQFKNIRIIKAKSSQDKRLSGLHLFNPNKNEIEDAKQRAFELNFRLIIIHDERTWGYYAK